MSDFAKNVYLETLQSKGKIACFFDSYDKVRNFMKFFKDKGIFKVDYSRGIIIGNDDELFIFCVYLKNNIEKILGMRVDKIIVEPSSRFTAREFEYMKIIKRKRCWHLKLMRS